MKQVQQLNQIEEMIQYLAELNAESDALIQASQELEEAVDQQVSIK